MTLIAFVDCVSCLQHGSDRETCFTVALQFAIMHAYITASSVALAVRLPLTVPLTHIICITHSPYIKQAAIVVQWFGFYTSLKISAFGVDMIRK